MLHSPVAPVVIRATLHDRDPVGPIMSIPEIISVMPLAGLPDGEMRAVSLLGMSLLICNADGQVYAIENRCSHSGARLDAGRLKGHEITCPLHGGRFDVRTGACLKAPAEEPIRAFEVLIDAGKIHIIT